MSGALASAQVLQRRNAACEAAALFRMLCQHNAQSHKAAFTLFTGPAQSLSMDKGQPFGLTEWCPVLGQSYRPLPNILVDSAVRQPGIYTPHAMHLGDIVTEGCPRPSKMTPAMVLTLLKAM